MAARTAAPERSADPEAMVRAFLLALTQQRHDEAAALMSEAVEWVDGATSRPVEHAEVFAEMRPVMDVCDESE